MSPDEFKAAVAEIRAELKALGFRIRYERWERRFRIRGEHKGKPIKLAWYLDDFWTFHIDVEDEKWNEEQRKKPENEQLLYASIYETMAKDGGLELGGRFYHEFRRTPEGVAGLTKWLLGFPEFIQKEKARVQQRLREPVDEDPSFRKELERLRRMLNTPNAEGGMPRCSEAGPRSSE